MTETHIDWEHINQAAAATLDAFHRELVQAGACRCEPNRPTIVVLCGSTRFYDAFQQANYDETMAGRIVLSVGFYPHAKAIHGHGEGVGHDSTEKVALDELHKRKIDLADEVLVLNVGGYIGESTRAEIAYAEALGKPIRWLEPETGTADLIENRCAHCGGVIHLTGENFWRHNGGNKGHIAEPANLTSQTGWRDETTGLVSGGLVTD